VSERRKKVKKYFYHDILDLEWIEDEINDLDISDLEKKKLAQMARYELHQTILDAVLSELNEREKKVFLANLNYDTNDRTWRHLSQNIEKVEEKIIEVSQKLKEDLKKDLADAKAGK